MLILQPVRELISRIVPYPAIKFVGLGSQVNKHKAKTYEK